MKFEEAHFKYVYVEDDGSVRELDMSEIEYLFMEFKPFDGARPYVKSEYDQLTPEARISGFLPRAKVPNDIDIKAAETKYVGFNVPFSMNDSGKTIHLDKGKYDFHIYGAWGVTVRNFTVIIKNIQNNELVKAKNTFWRYNHKHNGIKIKRIKTIQIPEKGNYIINFYAKDSLTVKYSDVYYIKPFQNQTPTHEIMFLINRSR